MSHRPSADRDGAGAHGLDLRGARDITDGLLGALGRGPASVRSRIPKPIPTIPVGTHGMDGFFFRASLEARCSAGALLGHPRLF
jgi:hypothetical protein